jgi:hypothetical protein
MSASIVPFDVSVLPFVGLPSSQAVSSSRPQRTRVGRMRRTVGTTAYPHQPVLQVAHWVQFTQTMSLDGYTAGPEQTQEEPLGKDGESLHEWMNTT